ncbi:MAG: nucleoside recognition domain-containing protein [Microbacter sp.]
MQLLNWARLWNCVQSGFPKATKTMIWLLKLMLPVALFVSFLQYWGVLNWLAGYLTPIFQWIGLPGIASVVFITSLFLPLYAVLAVIATLPLGMRDITILAIMCLISHSLIVETAVQRKTGSSAWTMFLVRVTTSFVAAMILNALLPAHFETMHTAQSVHTFHAVSEVLMAWFKSSISLIIKVFIIINGLIILQNILREYKWLDYISKAFAPLMRFFGLSPNVSFLWFVAQTLGLAYGSAVMIEEVKMEAVSKEEANMLNFHIAINHSLLEDTLLFVSIGVSAVWITFPRIILAVILVWLARLFYRIFRKTERSSFDAPDAKAVVVESV